MTLALRTVPPDDSWRERLDQLQAIYDLTQALARADALESVYEAALSGILSALRVDRASVLLFDPDRVMRFKAWRGLSDEYRSAVEGHTPWTPETRDPLPVLVEDVRHDKGLQALLPVFERERIEALAFFPLYYAERVLGKFMLYYDHAHVFSEDEVRLATTIANHVAFALERQRSSVALAESETLYRNLIATANEGVMVLTADATISLVNARMASIVGYEEADLRGRPLFDILMPEDVAQAKANLERRRRGIREQFDFRFRHKDGRTVWGIVNAAPIMDAAGTYQGSLTLISDITERKEAEERYRALADSLPQKVLMAIPDGPLTYVNEVWTAYTGMNLEETRGAGWRSLVHPEDRPETDAAWQKAHDLASQYQVETRLRRHDGQYRWHLATAQPITLPDGTIAGWVSSATDIHESKRAQERERFLAEAVALLSRSLDFEETISNLTSHIVPDFAQVCAIDVLEPEGEVRRIEVCCEDDRNVEAVGRVRVRNWRVSPEVEETIGERIAAGEGLLMPDIDEAWLDAIADSPEQAEYARALGVRSFIIVPLKTRNTVLGTMSLGLTRLEEAYDTADMKLALELAHHAATAIDNARLYEQSRALAERLVSANRAKDEFLGLVSHEMRTPITTIYGNAQVLRRIWQIIDENDRRTALADIEHDAERLQRIIENMLVLARVDAGQELATEPVLLNRLVSAAVEDMRNRYLSRRIDLRLPGEMITVVAQPTYLELVLRNLIGNAHKYSPPDAPINVTVEAHDGLAAVCVLDQGPGIAEDEAQRIFQPFYRSRNTAATAPGAGLGLAVCRRLIEALGGQVEASNRPEGGLSVCFKLPLDPAHLSPEV